MRIFNSILVLLLVVSTGTAQLTGPQTKNINKSRLYIYWGWNLDAFSKSDIHFKGDGYDFTLSDVTAQDRQSKYQTDVYLNPGTMTIPQYNFRIGYFVKENYSISLGMDHMKYVMDQYQIVKFTGHIDSSASTTFGGFNSSHVYINGEFLSYEHTDGLNYLNVDFRWHHELLSWKMLSLNTMAGLGAGALIPKTNAQLMRKERHDAFHLAGYGFNALAGANLTIYRHFFVQSELKGGFIDMPDVRTSPSKSDKASQHFWFSQVNIVFGVSFNLDRPLVKK
jgi:hypothetical protein